MIRVISSMEDKYLIPALDLIEGTFTQKHDHDEGMLVRNLVMEIRSKKYYIPKLELVMLDQSDNVIGYAMFSGFHIEGNMRTSC